MILRLGSGGYDESDMNSRIHLGVLYILNLNGPDRYLLDSVHMHGKYMDL